MQNASHRFNTVCENGSLLLQFFQSPLRFFFIVLLSKSVNKKFEMHVN